jgi:hypothetical protein
MVPPGVNQAAFFRTTGLGSWAQAVSKAVTARPSVWTAAALTDGRILVMQASADGARRVFAAPQQFVIGRDGTLRVAQAPDEGLVVGPDESEHDLSLQPGGESRQRGFGASIRGVCDGTAALRRCYSGLDQRNRSMPSPSSRSQP